MPPPALGRHKSICPGSPIGRRQPAQNGCSAGSSPARGTTRDKEEETMVASVLVVNADLGPLHRVCLRKALRMLWRKVAVIHEEDPQVRIGPWPMPKVLRLVAYVV